MKNDKSTGMYPVLPQQGETHYRSLVESTEDFISKRLMESLEKQTQDKDLYQMTPTQTAIVHMNASLPGKIDESTFIACITGACADETTTRWIREMGYLSSRNDNQGRIFSASTF